MTVSNTTAALIALLQQRDALGRAKYGTTLDRTDLSLRDWLQHQLEELRDAAGYAMAAIRKLDEQPEAAQTAGEAEHLRPMETAPNIGIFRLIVESQDGERRVFAAEACFDGREEGARYWMITTGWPGWTRIPLRWNPVGWLPMTPEPAPSAPADVEALAADEGPLGCAELHLRMQALGCNDRDDGSLADGLKSAREALRRLSGAQQAEAVDAGGYAPPVIASSPPPCPRCRGLTTLACGAAECPNRKGNPAA